jgi:hypothetical protein
VLPRIVPTSDRDAQARLLDAMTLVQHFEKPGYFATMTQSILGRGHGAIAFCLFFYVILLVYR